MQPQRERVAPDREDADEHGDRRGLAEPLEELVEQLEVEDDLRHREVGAGVELAAEALDLDVQVVRGQVPATPVKNDVAASMARPLKSSPRLRWEISWVSPIASTS